MLNRTKRPSNKSVSCAIVILAILGLTTATSGKLAANKLAANKLSPLSAASNSAAASILASEPIAVGQPIMNRYVANPVTAGTFMATADGREVFAFLVACALPADVTLVATLPDSSTLEFFGELNLANEWLQHPLRKAGRGWVSACLFARVNDSDVPLAISFRGQHQGLATLPEEIFGWTLEEGAFYGDYFVAPGEPVQWVACRGRDQALGEIGGLIERDCTEPDPNDPTRTKCGFTYAGNCASSTSTPICDHFSPHSYYRSCSDNAGDESQSDVFRQIITVFAAL